MLVQDIMVPKDKLIRVSAMDKVRDALLVMRTTGVKSLVVNKKNTNDAYGLLTFKNVLYSIVANEGDIDLLRVYDIYSKPAIQVSKQLDIKYASQMMIKNDVKRLLVVDDNHIQGILTMTDILGALLKSLEEA